MKDVLGYDESRADYMKELASLRLDMLDIEKLFR